MKTYWISLYLEISSQDDLKKIWRKGCSYNKKLWGETSS